IFKNVFAFSFGLLVTRLTPTKTAAETSSPQIPDARPSGLTPVNSTARTSTAPTETLEMTPAAVPRFQKNVPKNDGTATISPDEAATDRTAIKLSSSSANASAKTAITGMTIFATFNCCRSLGLLLEFP